MNNGLRPVKVHIDNPNGKDYYAIRYKAYKYKKNFIKNKREKVSKYLSDKKKDKIELANRTDINSNNKYNTQLSIEKAKELVNNSKILVDKHIPNLKSNWSGEVIVNNTENENGYSASNKYISLCKNADLSDATHEYLHSCSLKEKINTRYLNHEEIACELLMQKIFGKEGLTYKISNEYQYLINTLRNINSKINIYDDEYEFAKEYYLKDSGSGERYYWFNNIVLDKIKNFDLNDKIEIYEMLNAIN